MSFIRLGCLIMASGQSKRFGSNKLLAPFGNIPLLEHTLSHIPQNLFYRKIVITRTPECCEIAKKHHFSSMLHTLPQRKDAIRLGIQQMCGLDGCLFVQADQPLCRTESYQALVRQFSKHPTGFVRLGWKHTAASPVLFPASAFEQLANLPNQSGGSAVLEKNKENIFVVQAKYEWELWDIDTPDDLQRILAMYTLFHPQTHNISPDSLN